MLELACPEYSGNPQNHALSVKRNGMKYFAFFSLTCNLSFFRKMH